MSLTPEEVHRYARHIMLKEVGGPGQNKLKAAKVALVGVGGLGAPAALYLAAAGVGQLTLIDDDAVALSNLQRQVLFTTNGVASLKVAEAATALRALNPHVGVHQQLARLTPDNADRLLTGADLVLDGSDSFETRFAVNAACHRLGVRLVSGAVGRWDGQLGVFASGLTKGRPPEQRNPCYQCFVPQAPPDAETCAAVGIIGALPGVIGAAMALEAVKLITGAGDPLIGRLFLFDALHLEARTLRLSADPACAICGPPHR
jgi:molybdopterin-synthase adenylyltransferase